MNERCPRCGGLLLLERGLGAQLWLNCFACGYEEYAGADRELVQATAQRVARKPSRQLDPGEMEWDE